MINVKIVCSSCDEHEIVIKAALENERIVASPPQRWIWVSMFRNGEEFESMVCPPCGDKLLRSAGCVPRPESDD